MTNYELIKNMSAYEMALLFHALCKGVDDQWTDTLILQGIDCIKVSLADEIQIALHKQFLESEV